MSAKKGIDKKGNRSIQAVLSKFFQIDGKKVAKLLNPATLLLEEKNKVLREITLIKGKWCGKLKGRMCADGRKQHPYISKDIYTSPTVSTEVLVITLVIDAAEDKDVATYSIARAYLNTKMDFLQSWN